MTRHRTITGFVAVALLAVAAANMRPHPPLSDRSAAAVGMVSFKELTAGANKLPTEDFDDQSLVYSAGTTR